MSSSSATSDSSEEMRVVGQPKASITAGQSPNSNLRPKPPTEAPESSDESSGSDGSGSDSDDDKDDDEGGENSGGSDGSGSDDKDDDEGGENASGSDGSDDKDDVEGGEKSSGSSGSDDKDDDEGGKNTSGSDGSDDKDDGEGGEKSSGSSGSDSDGNEPSDFNSDKPQHPPIATKSSDSVNDSGSDRPAPPLGHSARVPSSSTKALTTKPMDDHKNLKPQEEQQGGGSQKRLPFQRIWTEDDEIALLQGLIHYQEENGHGSLPATADMDALHELLRESLSIDVSNTQLSEKVRSLKKKYLSAVARGKYVMEPSFFKSHDRDVFELSKQIWGKNVAFSVSGYADEFTDDDATVKRRKIKPEPRSLDNSDETAFEHDDSPYTLLREVVSKAGHKQTASIAGEEVKMLGGSKVGEVVSKYNKLTLLEMKNDLRRMDLLKESVKLFMDALKKMV